LPIATVIELVTGKHLEHIGGTVTGNINNTAVLAILVFLVIHASGILQVFRDLVRGTYGHHAITTSTRPTAPRVMKPPSTSNICVATRCPPMSRKSLAALGDPTKHYADDEHPSHGGHSTGHNPHGKGMSIGKAALLAFPLYLWNFRAASVPPAGR